MAGEIDFAAYIDAQERPPEQQQPEPDAEEFKPRLTTFYYPQTPEQTRAAGLSYRMEGGTQGGGKFGDIDLRQHTLEKYQAGESPWVAVAMPGAPTGKIYNIPYGDGYIKGRNVDTGGGLQPGQVDIATSNPELARGYAKRDEYVSEFPRVSTEIPESRIPEITESDIDRLLGKGEKKEEPKRTAKARPAPSAPRPIPRVDVNIPQMPMAQIGLPDLSGPGMSGGLGQPIPPPQMPIAQAEPLPMPTPQFGIGVQEAIEQVPQEALLAGPPTGASIDFADYIARNQAPSVTPSPTPSVTPAQAPVDFGAYIARNTSGQELPPPEIGAQEPGVVQKVGTALGRYATGFLPRSAQDVAAMSGVPTGLSPEQLAPLVMPMLKPSIDIARQGMTRAQQIRGLEEKGVPAGAQERYDVGIGTALDVAGLAGLRFLGRGKGAKAPRTLYRGGGIGSPPKGKTAADIVAYETTELGNKISPARGIDLKTIPAEQTQWLSPTEAAAAQFGEVQPVEGQFRVLATDPDGGMLVAKVEPPPKRGVQSVTDIPEEYLREAKEEPVQKPQTKRSSVWWDEQKILDKVLGDNIGTNKTLADSRSYQIRAEIQSDLVQLGWNKLKPAEKAQLDAIRVIQEGTQPELVLPADWKPTRRVAKIADFLRNTLEHVADEYERLGATVEERPLYRDKETGQVVQESIRRPFERIKNYWPRKIDQNKIAQVPTEPFIQDMQRLNPGLSPTDIADVVSWMKARALGLKEPQLATEAIKLVKGDPYKPSHLHARTSLNYPEYVYRSVYYTIPEYIEMSSRERGFLEVFGPEADAAIEKRITDLNISNEDVALASEVWDKYRGRFLDPESNLRARQAGHILNNIGALTLLGVQTMVLQPSQLGMLIGRFHYNMARSLGRFMVDPKGSWIEARRAGSFINSILNENSIMSRTGRQAMRGEIGPRASLLRKAEVLTAKLSSEAMKFAGVQVGDKMPRALGYWAAKYALQGAQRAALKGNKKAQALLKEAGIDVASDAHDVARGAGKLTREYNITSDNMPYWLQNTPVGSFTRSLQTFNVQVSRRMWNSFIKPAMKGDVAPLLRLLASSVVIGEGIGQVRDWLTGRRTRPGGDLAEFLDDVIHGRSTKMDIAKRALDDLAWSGTMGYAQNIYQAFKYGQSFLETGTRLAGTISGAGLSNVAEIAAGTGALITGGIQAAMADSEDEKSRRQYENNLRTGWRILGRRIPVLGGVIAPRAFPSAAADRRVAIEGMKRARKRGDAERYRDWEDWFMRRHPDRRISEKALEKD